MGTKTKVGKVAIEWLDAHAVDAVKYPTPATEEWGSWLATVRGVEVELRWHGERWIVCVNSGMAGPYAEGRTLAEAKDLVAHATLHGGEVRDVIYGEADRRAKERSINDALEAIEHVADGRASCARPVRFAWALRQVLRAAAQRGFQCGEVVETWREKARGRWVSPEAMLDGPSARDPRSMIRVEGEHVLEVFEQSPEEGTWNVEVDDVYLVEIRGKATACEFALDHAKKLDRKRAAS